MKQNKLLLLLLTMLLPMMASAAAVKINGIYYNLVSKTKKAEVTSNPDMYSGKVVIPKTVTYEGMKCNVTSIGSCAFWGCSGLTSVTIPNSVTSIGEAAFSGCTSLTSVTIPTSVTSIGKSAFYWCTGLTSVIIPSSVTSIGIDAFCGCSGLISVAIPNSVTTIDDMAFQSCNGLTTVSFGSGIQYIGYKAFAGCPELTDVRCYAENVPETQSDAFDGSYIEYATLHVPKGCLDAYKAVEPWKNFKEKVEMVDAKVKLSKTKATIEKGKTLTLKATITPTDLPDKSVTWKSSNTKIAKVTSDGEVIA